MTNERQYRLKFSDDLLLSTKYKIFVNDNLKTKSEENPYVQATVFEFVTENEFAGGSGTEADPYLISKGSQLNRVRKHLDKHFEQIADVDLSPWSQGAGWVPIGSPIFVGSINPFTGQYNGNNKKISNLRFYSPYQYYAGLFGQAKKAVFKNIIIENADVEARTNVGILLGEGNGSVIIGSKVSGNVRGINNTGGLVGYLWGTGCRVVNCKSYANVDCQVSDAGGLIGFNLQAEITGCHTYGNVVCDTNVGGLIGRLRGTNQITDCHFHGKTQGLTQYAGGLVGIAEKASLSNLITIDDCSISGKVTGQNDVGGLIGQIKDVPVNMTKSRILNQIAGGNQVGGLIGSLIGGNAQIAGCYVLENVSATGDEIGGLIGYAGAMLTVSNSFARGDVEGGKHVGGLVGRTIAAYSSITDTYSMGDIQSSVSSSVGGLVGWSRKITINRCFATGKITTPKPGDPSAGSGGGLVGKFEDNSVIQNSMALNSYMWGLGVFGRVIGEVNGSTITNVYAFDEMKSLEDDSILPEGNVNDKNGKNVAKSNAAGEVNKDFWTNPAKLNWSNFDSNWEFVSGTNLPQLKNLPASPDPEHFK